MDLQSLKPNTDSNDAASPISKMADSLSPQSNNASDARLPKESETSTKTDTNRNYQKSVQTNSIKI